MRHCIYVVVALEFWGVSSARCYRLPQASSAAVLLLQPSLGFGVMLPLIYASITIHDVPQAALWLAARTSQVGANLRHLGTTLFGSYYHNKSYRANHCTRSV